MFRAVMVTVALLGAFDLLVCDGKYTAAASQVSTAVLRQFR
jgi:hypothetical protein